MTSTTKRGFVSLASAVARRIRDDDLIREGLRSVLTRLNAHRPDQAPDVVIVSTPRSGSTWLMEVLATEPGMKPIDEPFRASKLRRAGIPVHSPSARRRPSRASPTFLPNMRSSTAHTSETSAGCGIVRRGTPPASSFGSSLTAGS